MVGQGKLNNQRGKKGMETRSAFPPAIETGSEDNTAASKKSPGRWKTVRQITGGLILGLATSGLIWCTLGASSLADLYFYLWLPVGLAAIGLVLFADQEWPAFCSLALAVVALTGFIYELAYQDPDGWALGWALVFYLPLMLWLLIIGLGIMEGRRWAAAGIFTLAALAFLWGIVGFNLSSDAQPIGLILMTLFSLGHIALGLVVWFSGSKGI